jgi:hypothetical protein
MALLPVRLKKKEANDNASAIRRLRILERVFGADCMKPRFC